MMPVVLCVLAAGMALTGSVRAQDDVWPRDLVSDKGTITVYQPQNESLDGDVLVTRAAVAVKPKGSDKLIFGAVWFRAHLLTDRESMTATLDRIEVTAARFPELSDDQVEAMSRFMEAEIPRWDLVISLDNLVADLAQQEQRAHELEGFNMAPPEIIYSDRPAVLVLVDGDPHWRPAENSTLEYLANSAFFVVRLQGGRSLFLRGAGLWFSAPGLDGPWTVTDRLPEEVAALTPRLEEEERKEAEQMSQDAGDLGETKDPDAPAPDIVVRTRPAELVQTDGAADLAPVAGTQLLYVRNSESDILLDIASQQYYLLLAGRWYRSSSLEQGPWEYVDAEQLPADFARIPADSPASGVLASVPGTVEAREAVLDNQIPQTAEVDRKKATVKVTYDGDPKFESCGKGVAYALNTDKSVLLIDKVYYCCDQAIWFTAEGPEGPWAVATQVPEVIQDLPPDCPVYNVKYVTIYESTPEVVYVGYYPGYYGSYVYGPCVIYGTGWYYHPWYGHWYYPRPVTYGFGVHYNPWTGWGFTFGISYNWLHVGVGWYRPYHPGMWGAAGYRYGYRAGYWHGYHQGHHRGYYDGVRAGYRPAVRHNAGNIYRQRSEGIKRTGGEPRPGARLPTTSDRRNDVYSDRDGNVYRDRDGKWEQRDKGEWTSRDVVDRERPATRDQQPATRDQQPATRDQKPATRDQQPATRNQQPATRDQQPPQRDTRQVDRPQATPRDRQQQLDRDRASRQRGTDRQQQAPQRTTPQRRSGGGARRR